MMFVCIMRNTDDKEKLEEISNFLIQKIILTNIVYVYD